MDDTDDASPHRSPAIDRMMDVLEVLERRPGGTTLGELTQMVRIPRSTVYRLLNSLEAHEMVSRLPRGAYRLGPRLLRFSVSITVDTAGFDLVALATPHLEKLSRISGEGCRMSVVDRGQTLVLAAAQGSRDYALAVKSGQHLPIYAGAGSKVLLSFMPAEERAALLREPVTSLTPRTITDLAALEAECETIRRQGWSHDGGEFSINVNAYGAPVFDQRQKVIAAVSVSFLAGKPAADAENTRRLVIAAAQDISAELLAAPAPSELKPVA